MNGSTLLNYARFRDDDEGDYGRTRRQQQVMTAVYSKLKILQNFSQVQKHLVKYSP